MMEQKGNIFNIQRFTIHDGPGVRTEIFMKGCPLQCWWCGNPESQLRKIQPGVYSNKCISAAACGLCEKACPGKGALQFKDGVLEKIDYSRCTECLECSRVCPADAVKQWGEIMSVDQCMEYIIRDTGYYERSGGGVTVSGGEPLLQADFVEALFKKCKEKKIHTCVETTLYADWEKIQRVIKYSDLILSDLKHMDPEIHKRYTGVDNKIILENLKRLSAEGKRFILRIPVIPMVNDDMDNIKATADFIINEMDNKIDTLQLLSFMRLGEEKYKSLGREYKMEDTMVDREQFQKKVGMIAGYFSERGIHCIVGTKESKS